MWGCGWVVFLAKGTKSRTLVFLISDKKKGTSKLTKMAILRKKGTLGSQWQSLINNLQFCNAQYQLPPLVAALALSSILLHFQSKANVAAEVKPVEFTLGGEHHLVYLL